MVLPPVDKTPVFLMRFTPEAPKDLIQHVKERLAVGGIITVTTEGECQDEDVPIKVSSGARKAAVVLGLTTTQELLENEAELIKLVKHTTAKNHRYGGIMDHFTVISRNNFLDQEFRKKSEKAPDEDDVTEYDSFGLFTSSDRVLLLESMLDALHVLDENSKESKLSKQLDELKIPYHHERGTFKSLLKKGSSSVSPLSLSHVLEGSWFVDVISPVHIRHIRRKILHQTLSPFSRHPLHAARSYYGESLAYYFAWILHLNTWLQFPAILGLSSYIIRMYRGDTVDNCIITPFVGFGTFLWSVFYLRFWDREEARLAFAWGTYSTKGLDSRNFGKRAEFTGELRLSPVTDRMEKYYSPSKRRLKYLANALVTVVLLAGVCTVMVLSLNLQGYIGREDQERWGEEAHPLYFPWFASFAEHGNIFDAGSSWKSYLPIIIHVFVVTTMNKKYRGVAEKLTEWENNETKVDHDNSLILKRFLFEAFDAYIILIYLVFYERDIYKLRGELRGIFNVDVFRRVFLECIIPYVGHKISGTKKKTKAALKKKLYNQAKPEAGVLTYEADLDEYDQFDDYLEMIIQFGYITLFASAYPLAAFVAIISNSIEFRADMFKLSKVHLRPRVVRKDTIGTWKLLLKVIVFCSTLTNCVIFCITSRQAMQWIPENYTTDQFGQPMFASGRGDEAMLMMFGIEHALLFIAFLIWSVIPGIPEDVLVQEERRQWLHEQMSRSTREQMIGKIRSSQKLSTTSEEKSRDTQDS